VVAGRADLIDPFLDGLAIELARLGQPVPVDTLFWGGGTPTQLSRAQLARLVDLTQHWLPLDTAGEWTCEANPLDCTVETLGQLRAAGVTRLSLGGQSFQADKLRRLERDHTPDDLHRALERAMSVFPSVSLDLIFAAPEETLEQWLTDLRSAIAHQIHHVSTYGLTIEKGAAFFARQLHGHLTPVDEDVELKMYLGAIECLSAAGYEHYEVSNFAQPHQRCRHNEAYWLGRPWLAFGPGAAGYDGHARTVNHRSLHTYLRRLQLGQSPVAERDELTAEQRLRERFVFGLRRLEGIDLVELNQDHAWDIERLLEPYLSRALDRGWFVRDGSRIRLTRAGLVISDALWPDFLQPSAQ